MLPFQTSLELHEQEQRIRKVLGLEKGHLPKVDIDGLRKYHCFLATNLKMPFDAQYTDEADANRQIEYFQVKVLSVIAPDEKLDEEYHGLICRVGVEDREMDVPLVDLEVGEENANFQLIEDYWYWIWNWRFDPII
jgi:hypothetical protein